MQVQVSRWGNSLGLRIPKDIAIRAGLREGTRVDIEIDVALANDPVCILDVITGICFRTFGVLLLAPGSRTDWFHVQVQIIG